MRNTDLTVHCVVKNEPFIWYAVKSVYDIADHILLYDTGSDDLFTINDIRVLQAQDKDNKIIVRRFSNVYDSTSWAANPNEIVKIIESGKPFLTLGHIRQMMIDDTETPFFMILDGDEVYYRDGARFIHRLIDTWPEGIYCIYLPLLWFADLNNIFEAYPYVGRLFFTPAIRVNNIDYVAKMTGESLEQSSSHVSIATGCPPFAHFEAYLKPWYKKVERVTPIRFALPEVMKEEPELIQRLEHERTKAARNSVAAPQVS